LSREIRPIVRLHGTSLDGTKPTPYALMGIKGIGQRIAWAIVRRAGIDPNTRLGALSEGELKKLEAIIEDPASWGLPTWLFNRRKDPRTGRDLHLLGSDLELQVKTDIELMKEIRCWKGERHARGLKVRGQRTKTTGRKGRTVGVVRKRR